MTADQLQAFLIGAGVGVCLGVVATLQWHVGRVRELWRHWAGQP